ncbi:hypothetical protein [Holzapfeliella sp. JNUCC 72]
MEKQQQKQLKFIGKVAMPSMLEANGSFYSQFQELEDSQVLNQLDETNQLAKNRSSLIVFGPENYMYWQGLVYEGELAELPKGLMSYDLPESTVATMSQEIADYQFHTPLSFELTQAFDSAKKAGIEIPANLGLSEHPYFLQSYVGDATQGLTKSTSVYLGNVIDNVND